MLKVAVYIRRSTKEGEKINGRPLTKLDKAVFTQAFADYESQMRSGLVKRGMRLAKERKAKK